MTAGPRSGQGGGRRRVAGVLLLYHRPVLPWEGSEAGNVNENIEAFGRYSKFGVKAVNTAEVWNPYYGYQPDLADLEFDAILMHYSLFRPGLEPYWLSEPLREHVKNAASYKIAAFQDEHHWCKKRYGFIDEFGIDCVLTALEPPYAEQVYKGHTNVSTVVSVLPGYVSQELVEAADRLTKPDEERRIDVGYRGRPIPAYMGRGSQEKIEIGTKFAERAPGTGLTVDIAITEEERIYGEDWYRFLADCRGTLGSESGVSCFDPEDEVLAQWEELSAKGHEPTLEELERGALGRWDWKIPYRTIAPRNFEAAALHSCQILFEGDYSGLMEPMRHYIPMKKDFSNFDEVVERFRDRDLRRELTENARRDLIDSGENTNERMVATFDAALIDAGLTPAEPTSTSVEAAKAVHKSPWPRFNDWRTTRLAYLWTYHRVIFWIVYPLNLVFEAPFRLLERIRRRRRGE